MVTFQKKEEAWRFIDPRVFVFVFLPFLLCFFVFFLSCLGLLPKTLNEWKLLLELLLSRDHQDDKCTHLCAQLASPDWSADLTWSNVTKLMLERLGAGHTVNLLQALALDTPHLSGDFYYSCLLGAVIERRQRYKRPEIIILFSKDLDPLVSQVAKS